MEAKFTGKAQEGLIFRDDLIGVQRLSRTAGQSSSDISRILQLPEDNQHTGRVVFAGANYANLLGRKVTFLGVTSEIMLKGRSVLVMEAKDVVAIAEEDAGTLSATVQS